MASSHPRSVKRGNTSGLIGLWNQKAETDHSANVTGESLRLRETANRRISAREPPKLSTLEIPASHALSSLRKTSEINRPTFKIKEEDEFSGVFASGILREKPEPQVRPAPPAASRPTEAPRPPAPSFSFMGRGAFQRSDSFQFEKGEDVFASKDVSEEKKEGVEAREEEELYHKELERIKRRARAGRRGSKTTDDICEVTMKRLDAVEEEEGGIGRAASRRGSGIGLARSKSVKIQRVKFGLIPMAETEGKNQSPFLYFSALASEKYLPVLCEASGGVTFQSVTLKARLPDLELSLSRDASKSV